MSLGEHLRELRRRVVISAVAVVVATIVAFIFHNRLLHFITKPYCDLPQHLRVIQGGRCTLIATGILEPFTITLRLSLYGGLLLSSPVWLWQLWRFITPGLYQRERRWALLFVGCSVGLFAAGGTIAYFTLHNGLHFLLGFASGGIAPLPSFSSYLSYVVAMVLVFSVSFEFPLVLVMLNFARVLSYERLWRWWRGIVFGIFVFAGVATPSQDPFTMTALAVPMCLLYFLALLIARVHDRRVANRERESAYAHLADDELSPLDDQPAVN